MFKIYFLKTDDRQSSIKYLLETLNSSQSKDARIKFNKINNYFFLLETYGLNLGEPYIKKIDDNLWELRPLRFRIFFTSINDKLIMLHYFIKKSRKTPIKEIEKAKKEIQVIKKGENNYE